jgi:hypothetical protein
VAVAADDLAFLHLVGELLFPYRQVNEPRNVLFLVAEVVEFEDSHVGLTAIRAWVALEVVKDESAPECPTRLDRGFDLLEVKLAAGSEVHPEAFATPPLVAVASPVECIERESLLAASASPS